MSLGLRADRTAGRGQFGPLHLSVALLSFAGGCAITALAAARPSGIPGIKDFGAGDVVWTFAQLGFVLIGLVVMPHNRIVGWLVLLAGLIPQLANLTFEYALAGATHMEDLPAVGEAALFSAGMSVAVAAVFASFLFRFPTGYLPSRRWKHAARLPLLALVPLIVAVVLAWPHRGVELLMDQGTMPGAADAFAAAAFLLLMLSAALGVASLMSRYRASDLVEKQQLKWLALASLLTVLTMAIQTASPNSVIASTASGIAILAIPVAIAVALLRYRLYDIDRFINRTLVYLGLSVLLGAIYVSGVALARALLPVGSGDIGVAASTLMVAALFNPSRRRIQEGIDRVFYRSRYDAFQVAQRFATTLRHEMDLDSIENELLRAISESVRPATASIWLPVETELHV